MELKQTQWQSDLEYYFIKDKFKLISHESISKPALGVAIIVSL